MVLVVLVVLAVVLVVLVVLVLLVLFLLVLRYHALSRDPIVHALGPRNDRLRRAGVAEVHVPWRVKGAPPTQNLQETAFLCFFKLASTARAFFFTALAPSLMLGGGVRPLLPLLLSRSHIAVVHMSVGDAAAAANLFANVRLPASILAGALVPLGFGFALPAEGPALAPGTRRAVIRLHRLVAVTSYSCLLLAIVYASVTINGLAESPHQVP